MIETLIHLGSFLVDFFKAKALIDDKDDGRIQDVLDKVADLLDSISTDLENDTYPTGKCAEMEFLANELHDTLKDEMDDSYLEFLTKNLNSAFELEKLYAYKDDPVTVEKIKMAAGYFRAAAILSKI